MRKFFLFATAVFITSAVFAQQMSFGGQNIISPEINPNNSVTFRLFAPQADKVEVTGDFLPTQKMETPYGNYDASGTAELTKNYKTFNVSLLKTC